jgi:hypothetical protein
MMTRREFVCTAAIATFAPAARTSPLIVPVHRVMDSRAKCTPEQFRYFWSTVWPEAVRDFARGGIRLQTTDATGEIRRTAGDRPNIIGLERGVINMVFTDHIPMKWDNARALPGVTTLYEGYPVCVIAIAEAHRDQIPFLSVNTCVHELLHALMQDIFVSRPKWYQAAARESRIDWFATRLWLFHEAASIRQSAQVCLHRIRSHTGAD